ncbi:hypothetical protein SISSUDRAFT_1061833 [Sistotremastrum suecicum HHB10207 ss-3]|uniref:Uncharacterized protein n=1 Tax=Sistotremastrum suecicum HHB10207 ss-3 TaxID=1314776 RepID=A0A166DME1_9AGAM|nr:hypothetical protein SISSUDRAFT_1061833 [Sistotremastrum suecicum HHB10207 ss-3]
MHARQSPRSPLQPSPVQSPKPASLAAQPSVQSHPTLTPPPPSQYHAHAAANSQSEGYATPIPGSPARNLGAESRTHSKTHLFKGQAMDYPVNFLVLMSSKFADMWNQQGSIIKLKEKEEDWNTFLGWRSSLLTLTKTEQWLSVLSIAQAYEFTSAKKEALEAISKDKELNAHQRLRISIDHHLEDWFLDALVDVVQTPLRYLNSSDIHYLGEDLMIEVLNLRGKIEHTHKFAIHSKPVITHASSCTHAADCDREWDRVFWGITIRFYHPDGHSAEDGEGILDLFTHFGTHACYGSTIRSTEFTVRMNTNIDSRVWVP